MAPAGWQSCAVARSELERGAEGNAAVGQALEAEQRAIVHAIRAAGQRIERALSHGPLRAVDYG